MLVNLHDRVTQGSSGLELTTNHWRPEMVPVWKLSQNTAAFALL